METYIIKNFSTLKDFCALVHAGMVLSGDEALKKESEDTGIKVTIKKRRSKNIIIISDQEVK